MRPIDESDTGRSAKPRSDLLRSALEVYIRKTEANERQSRSWIHQPNNFISVIAVVISIMGVIYGFYKDWRDGIDRNLQALSTVVAELTKLDSDLYSNAAASQASASATPPGSPPSPDQARLAEYARSLNNHRLALLAEADRLTDDLGERAPKEQLAVLGPAFVQVSDYEKAKKYFSLATQPPASPQIQATAWRSMALASIYEGPDHYDEAAGEFDNAAKLVANAGDAGSIEIAIETQQQWGELEFRRQDANGAAQHFLQERKVLLRLPCPAAAQFMGALNLEMQQAMAALTAAHPDQAKAPADAWNAATRTDQCGLAVPLKAS